MRWIAVFGALAVFWLGFLLGSLLTDAKYRDREVERILESGGASLEAPCDPHAMD